eukprot:768500-Hanusia_phi.AAC.2
MTVESRSSTAPEPHLCSSQPPRRHARKNVNAKTRRGEGHEDKVMTCHTGRVKLQYPDPFIITKHMSHYGHESTCPRSSNSSRICWICLPAIVRRRLGIKSKATFRSLGSLRPRECTALFVREHLVHPSDGSDPHSRPRSSQLPCGPAFPPASEGPHLEGAGSHSSRGTNILTLSRHLTLRHAIAFLRYGPNCQAVRKSSTLTCHTWNGLVITRAQALGPVADGQGKSSRLPGHARNRF